MNQDQYISGFYSKPWFVYNGSSVVGPIDFSNLITWYNKQNNTFYRKKYYICQKGMSSWQDLKETIDIHNVLKDSDTQKQKDNFNTSVQNQLDIINSDIKKSLNSIQNSKDTDSPPSTQASLSFTPVTPTNTVGVVTEQKIDQTPKEPLPSFEQVMQELKQMSQAQKLNLNFKPKTTSKPEPKDSGTTSFQRDTLDLDLNSDSNLNLNPGPKQNLTPDQSSDSSKLHSESKHTSVTKPSYNPQPASIQVQQQAPFTPTLQAQPEQVKPKQPLTSFDKHKSNKTHTPYKAPIPSSTQEIQAKTSFLAKTNQTKIQAQAQPQTQIPSTQTPQFKPTVTTETNTYQPQLKQVSTSQSVSSNHYEQSDNYPKQVHYFHKVTSKNKTYKKLMTVPPPSKEMLNLVAASRIRVGRIKNPVLASVILPTLTCSLYYPYWLLSTYQSMRRHLARGFSSIFLIFIIPGLHLFGYTHLLCLYDKMEWEDKYLLVEDSHQGFTRRARYKSHIISNFIRSIFLFWCPPLFVLYLQQRLNSHWLKHCTSEDNYQLPTHAYLSERN